MILGVCKYCVCKYCGCTDSRPCAIPAGDGRLQACFWINEDQPICSACLSRMSPEDLLEAMAIDHQRAGGAELSVIFDSAQLCAIVGLVQLALRHPNIPPFTRDLGATFVAQVAEYLSGCNLFVLAELIRRGGDPAHDVVVSPAAAEPQSKIILL